jgi:glyoxylase-like metal-dependent hydrolase (beta-lactamase superfamily II)
LSINAKNIFDPDNKFPPFDYDDNLMIIDEIIKEGDKINLGDISILILETPGHTKCSLSFFLEESKVLFTSETIGVLMNSGKLVPAFVISYEDSLKAVERCRSLNPEHIIVPHTGILKHGIKETFFDNAKKEMVTYKEFICKSYNSGMTYEEVLEALADSVKEDLDANGQPKKAFMLNAAVMVKNVIKEYCINR